MKIRIAQTVVRKTKWRALQIKEEMEFEWNGIAWTFESHCANWRNSYGTRQNQREPKWITYVKGNYLGQ